MLFHFTFDFFPSSHLLASFHFPYTDISLHFLPWCFLLYGWGCFVLVFFLPFCFAIQDNFNDATMHFAVCCCSWAVSLISTQPAFLFRSWPVATAGGQKIQQSGCHWRERCQDIWIMKKKKSLQKHKDSQIQIINFPLLVTSVEFHIYK